MGFFNMNTGNNDTGNNDNADNADNAYTFIAPDYRSQEEARKVRRAYAAKLAQQALGTQGQMVSGIYVPKSPWQNVAEGFAGGLQNYGIDTEAQQQAKDLQTVRAQLLQRMPSRTVADESGGHTDPNYAAKLNKWGLHAGQVPGMEILAKESAQEVFAGPRRMAEIQERDATRRDTIRANIEAATERERIRLEDKEAARQLSAEDRAAQSKQGAADREHLLRVAAGLRPTEAKAPSGYKLNPDGSLSAIPGGPADKPKVLTAAQQKAYDDSDVLLGHIDNALQSIKANPNAVGRKTVIPDIALQSIDPEGVMTRAAVAGLGATKVHELSGAAVSPAEFARLRPYLPANGDKADTVRDKLTNLRQEVERIKATHARGHTVANPDAQPPQAPQPAAAEPTVVRTGTRNGVKVQQMSDGSIREVQ